jgi:TATA-binding protein-associated factor
MPAHTAASALVKLYSFNGSPWDWPKWQERTGIYHGLFPDDDKHLPKGWTRRNANDVLSYFRAYQKQSTEDKKIAFAVNCKTASAFPGREFWNAFVSRQWKLWDIHSVVVEELKEYHLHPLDILLREDVDGPWPNANDYLVTILDPLGMKLFGEEAFPSGVPVLPLQIRTSLHIIAQRSWNNIRIQVSTLKNRSKEVEATARGAFEGEISSAMFYLFISYGPHRS